METRCESCGMPMKAKEDFGGQNVHNKYCRYCTDSAGNLKPFDEKLADMTNFIMRTTDLTAEKARELACENMSKMPAWMEHFK